MSPITVSLLWLDCVASHSSEYMDQQIVHGTAKSVDPYTQKNEGPHISVSKW